MYILNFDHLMASLFEGTIIKHGVFNFPFVCRKIGLPICHVITPWGEGKQNRHIDVLKRGGRVRDVSVV